jgi:hypothetical protein
MAKDAARTPDALEARARQRATRREQAAGAAARAGGMLSLAVVLLGAPVAVAHSGHAAPTVNRAAAHAPAKTGPAADATS